MPKYLSADELLAQAKPESDKKLYSADEILAAYGIEPKKEKSAASRFLQGAGGEVLKAGGAIGGLIPGVGEDNQLAKLGNEGLDQATGFAGEAGKFVGSTAPYLMLPGSGIVRTAAESAALSAATTPGDLKDRATSGAVTGALTGLTGAAVPVVSKVYDIASRPFTAKSNAAREILKEIDTALPRQAPSVLDGRDLSQGPPLPRFGRVPDARATAGMLTDDPNILSLEMKARLRNPSDFFNRDNQNAAAIYQGLQKKAIPDIRANQMQDAVNANTGKLRAEAFNEAKANPTYKDDLLNYVTQKYKEPGFRVSDGRKLLDQLKNGLLLKPTTVKNTITGLSLKPKTKTKLKVTALPEDIYQKRKDLAALLTLKTLAPDELTTVARGNRQATMDIINNIDDALNNSSGGKFSDYLAEHSQQMKPIEQGRAFQDIIDKFETKPRIFGTDTPQITPAALRNAVDKETYVNLGKKGYVSNVGDTERATLDDMIDLLNTTENAKKGTVATIGSPTATFATSLMQDGVKAATGSQIPFKIYSLLNALGVTRGKRVLDDALLNPEKLQPILDEANRIKSLPPVTQRNKTLIKLLQSSTAGAANE